MPQLPRTLPLLSILLLTPAALAQSMPTLTLQRGHTTVVRTGSLVSSVTITRAAPGVTVQVGDLQVNFVADADAQPGARGCVHVVTEAGAHDLCATVGAQTSVAPLLP